MNNKPTPGPWHVSGSLILGNEGSTAICQMGKTTSAAERKANERLIVNAPRMYALLRKTTDRLGNIDPEISKLLKTVEG